MLTFFLRFFAIGVASVLSFLFISSYKQYTQLFILVLTLLDLGLFIKFDLAKRNPLFKQLAEALILLVSTALVQTLVLSSGGIYGPFFILTYLFILGLGLFAGTSATLLFQLSIVGLVIFQIRTNVEISGMFKNDPWLGVLYGASMLVIIPIMHYLVKTYHLKDSVLNKVQHYLKTSSEREASILQSLQEIVIVTDANLQVLSINSAAEKAFKVEERQFFGQNIFAVIHLVDTQGKDADKKGLLIENILRDQASRMIEGYNLTVPDRNIPLPVHIQIRPIAPSAQRVVQLVFIFTSVLSGEGNELHADLKEAKNATQNLYQQLFQNLSVDNELKLEIFRGIEEDIRLVQDISDHQIKKQIRIESVVWVINQSIGELQKLIQLLKIPIQIHLSPEDEAHEQSYQALRQNDGSMMLSSYFSVPMDIEWMKVFMLSLIKLHLIFVEDYAFGVSINMAQMQDEVKVEFLSHPISQVGDKIASLFVEYYPNIPKEGIKFSGSGLEGYLVSAIAKQFEISLENEFIKDANLLKTTARIKKRPVV